jgi:hypothetical protein
LQIAARGRAHRPGVELREPHALACEAVDVRRFVEGVAVAAEVGVTKIIREDEDEVRLRRK